MSAQERPLAPGGVQIFRPSRAALGPRCYWRQPAEAAHRRGLSARPIFPLCPLRAKWAGLKRPPRECPWQVSLRVRAANPPIWSHQRQLSHLAPGGFQSFQPSRAKRRWLPQWLEPAEAAGGKLGQFFPPKPTES
jgi:hypothetical protein